MRISPATLFVTVASIAVIGAIAAGISQIDSPSQARLYKLDTQRLSTLQKISLNIKQYWKAHNSLPEQLDQLSLSKRELKDAVTGQPYEYKINNPTSYQLCAIFDTPPNEEEEQDAPFNLYGDCSMPRWEHGKGRSCFTVSVKGCK